MEAVGGGGETRGAAALAAVATVLGYMLIVAGIGALLRHLVGDSATADARSVVSMKITVSAIGQFLGLFFLTLVLRQRGMTFGDLGLWRTPRPTAWLAAVVLAGLFVFVLLQGPLRSRIDWWDASAFRIYTAVLAGVAAGLREEILFRGYVMTELARGGVGITGQLLGSAVLFGLAHVGWSTIGHGGLATLAPIIINTSVAGLLYGAVYLLGGRSLMPVIAAHAATDMVIEPWLLLAMVSR